MYQGGITRGAKDRKAIALAFTGHEYAEGGATILNELQKHHGKASFFFTGKFVGNQELQPLVRRIAAEGHYFSVHSDRHLLYCSWDKERKLLVSRDEFRSDLQASFARYDALKLKAQAGRLFIPPFEHYNQQIVDWAGELGCVVINYTPGTRSNADYTGEADQNFVPSQVIFDSIVKREQTDPRGLNGFILLLHIGSGPGRADKFHLRFGELLDYLAGKGYEFVRVDELLAPAK
jgi:peptidoglycan/xylan/chitin deacetylase (PgdA/CDA1 family)